MENNIVKINSVEDKIIEVRGEKVLLDSDVAALYGVETKRVNEAVKN
ncbi:MAG: ORF6N domain-containing protein, partial [Bacteroidales bacterium]|nr:ORF6N domain-containing protein [Bacteroidales bacterium]